MENLENAVKLLMLFFFGIVHKLLVYENMKNQGIDWTYVVHDLYLQLIPLP